MKIPALMAVTAASLLTLSACGSSSSTTASPPSGGTNANANVAASAANGLHVATTSLGKVLADAGGNTVYMFSTDSSGKSTCNATCLQYWPPVAPGKAAPTVTGKVASTTTTTGGKVATVAGWPVYTFSQDHKPGDITGEGFSDFGGVWYAVSPSGQPVKAAGGSSPSGSSSAPTYGGGGGL